MPRPSVTNSKNRFEWKDSGIAHFRDVNAQVVGERLEQLSASKQGAPVNAEDIVSDAENRKSPLHVLFDWNDTTAAAKYRLHQARMLVTQIVVTKAVPGNGVQPTRAFVSVRGTEKGARGYIHVTRSSGFDMAASARKELESWCRRYAGVPELRGWVSQIYRVLEPALPAQLPGVARKVRVS